MGFFDLLFGSDKKPAPKKKKKKIAPPMGEAVATTPVDGLSPEILAAISASVNMMLEHKSDPAVVAAVTTAIMHARQGGAMTVKIKRTSNIWSVTGRQKIMDAHL